LPIGKHEFVKIRSSDEQPCDALVA